MTTHEALIAAREKIADRKNWCRGSLALLPNRQIASPRNPNAVKWCALGACYSIPRMAELAIWQLELAATELYNTVVISVNDRIGHKAVLRLFDHAIGATNA